MFSDLGRTKYSIIRTSNPFLCSVWIGVKGDVGNFESVGVNL